MKTNINFRRFVIKIYIFLLFFIKINYDTYAHNQDESLGEAMMHHMADSHQWHICTINQHPISIFLPIIIYSKQYGFDCFLSSNFFDDHHQPRKYKNYQLIHDKIISDNPDDTIYDLSITKNVAGIFFSILLMCLIFISVGKKYKNMDKKDNLHSKGLVPGIVDALIVFIRNDVAIKNIGEKHYKKFMPYLLTLFFFILFNNLLGLLPAAANVTGNIAVPFVLACITFLVTNISGNHHYWKHLFCPPVPKFLYLIMCPIEIVGLFIKPVTLIIRLFANVLSGHLILLTIINLIFILHSYYVGVGSVFLEVFMIFLKFLVSFLQAYVFTLLTSIYVGSAVKD